MSDTSIISMRNREERERQKASGITGVCRRPKCERTDLIGYGFCASDYRKSLEAGTLGMTTSEAERHTRNKALKKNYHITFDQYEWILWVVQNGKCAHPTCGAEAPAPYEGKRYWPVDHDHRCCQKVPTCGSCIRGILCIPCNNSLTGLWENQEWADGSISYLYQAKLTL